ncbi:transposase [Enterococcus faecium]|uniref:transposase n=1 Tax=Enterococcus faecium TaxID=1352 RepID=UPI000A183C8A|nr:transposase [Enterococcus faecium]SMJ10815.1 transposase [Enterococcus faecium]
MNDFTTEIVQTLVTKGDLNELFRSHLEKAINTLLRTELTAFLDYEKYDRTGFNSGNSRNGSYFRSIKTEYGELTLEIPRDRNGEFKQQTLPAYKRTNDTLETTIIHLFEKGVTMSEIADLIEKMYGHHYTPQTMSNMTKVLTEEVNAFKSRALNDKYVAIFMDATYIPLKRQTIAHKVRVKDRKEICDDFKAVYQANSKEEANTFLSGMIEKWKKNYPKVTQSLIENQDLLTFYDFPPSIRRTIYSTNLIESFNKQIKRYSRRKEQFQNEESLERFLVSIFDTYNQKFLNRSHKGFQQVTDTLVSMFTE